MGLAPLGAFTRGCDYSAKVISKPDASTGTAGIWLHGARGHYMQPTNLNLKAIARDAALRGDTKTLLHTLELLERLLPIAAFMDFCTELEELRLQGARPRPH